MVGAASLRRNRSPTWGGRHERPSFPQEKFGVELAIAKLIGARRVSRAYQAGHDLKLPLGEDRMLRIECRARPDGFGTLYRWLDERDLLIVKAHRGGAVGGGAAVLGGRDRPKRRPHEQSSSRYYAGRSRPASLVQGGWSLDHQGAPPVAIPPRAATRCAARTEAAVYLGISASKSTNCARPIGSRRQVLDGRLIFTVERLDEFLDALPG